MAQETGVCSLGAPLDLCFIFQMILSSDPTRRWAEIYKQNIVAPASSKPPFK